MGAVIHNGGKSSLNCLEGILTRAVVKMHCYGNGDVHVFNKITNDIGNNAVAGLPLCCTTCALDDHRRLCLLRCFQNGRRPLKIVSVECADAIMTLFSTLEHSFCAY